MSDTPWLTDPKYGGMSPASAKCSYEAWLAEGGAKRLPADKVPRNPEHFDKDAFDLQVRQIEMMLPEYAQSIADAEAWYAAWRARQPKGFRAARRAHTEAEAEAAE